ncbi:alpha/beta fold hydrolase [Brevibacillus sp. MCWH]|jgi:pimeloyl-[acyl-carrier protein] methyl ester esterase|uniref:alpha/beta fold hydrolase n=1 Tax=Brevibacillus sp. MCWH TaxID=2508871 RepID=UPI0014918CD5|nr:alpha/beta fold hydrolase [Brevibacillus sp. MCWH]NNV01273.1 alpha/beta fold hydrolase [Brevibacillus sp. MCWH]
MKAAMLWLNGWGMSDEVWCSMQSQFPECAHTVPDLSVADQPEAFYEIARQAALSTASLPLIAVGWSLGGMLAQRLAAEGLAAGLVLIGTMARFVRPREERRLGWLDAQVRRMERALYADRTGVMRTFWQSMFTAEERQQADSSVSVCDAWPLSALAAGLSYMREEDLRPHLGSITCPTLVIHGTADGICPFSAGEELAASIPAARLEAIVGGGHALPLVHCNAVADAIKRMVEHSVESSSQQTVQ